MDYRSYARKVMDSIFPGPITLEKFEYDAIPDEEDDDDTTGKNKPRGVPYFLNPFLTPNAGLMMSYLNVGIALYILNAPVTYYLIDTAGASSTQYSVYSTLITLPWSFKFAFGALSDSVPILGYRRKSWLAVGWVMYILISFWLAGCNEPDYATTTSLMFLMTCSYLLSDVCVDALVVERAKHECEEIKGAMQTAGYTIRSYGGVIGATIAAVLYNTSSWGWGLTIAQFFVLNGLVPLTSIIPSLWQLEEYKSNAPTPSLRAIWEDVWATLQLNAVWYPMIFIYTYAALQVTNPAWTNFLVEGLDFSDWDLGIISIASAVLFYVGMLVFKTYLFDAGWRSIYIFTTSVNFVFSLLQIVLVLRWNVALGIPDLPLAVGDQGMIYFMWGINMMPTCIMFLMLCPEGSEGVTYALLTTISNLAGTAAYDISTGLSYIWDTSDDKLSDGDYSGVLYLTYLTSALQLAPITLVWILPNSRAEQREWRDSGRRSFWGGAILLSVIIFTIVFTIGFNFYVVFNS